MTCPKAHNLWVVQPGLELGVSDAQAGTLLRAPAFQWIEYKIDSIYHIGEKKSGLGNSKTILKRLLKGVI